MAKVTLSRIFELSKALTTKAGQELEDQLTYISDLAELTLRLLRNGLTFGDNFDCELKTITIRSGEETVISTSQKKRALQVQIRKIVNDQYYRWSDFGWKLNQNGQIVVWITISGSPPATQQITVDLLILYG